MRLTFVLFQMSQLRAAKRVCKNSGTEAYYLAKSCNDVARREWLYRDGAARKVLGDRDFVFGDELTRENLLKIAVTAEGGFGPFLHLQGASRAHLHFISLEVRM